MKMPKKTHNEIKRSRYSYNPQKENALFPITLTNLMEEREITQIALAEKIGVSRQSIANYMKGRVFPPSGTLNQLARYFGVTTDFLLGKTKCSTDTPDRRSACDYTGLSPAAVECLACSDIFEGGYSQTSVLSTLIEDEHFWSFLTNLCRMYSIIDQAEEVVSLPNDEYIKIYWPDSIDVEDGDVLLPCKNGADGSFYSEKMRFAQDIDQDKAFRFEIYEDRIRKTVYDLVIASQYFSGLVFEANDKFKKNARSFYSASFENQSQTTHLDEQDISTQSKE